MYSTATAMLSIVLSHNRQRCTLTAGLLKEAESVMPQGLGGISEAISGADGNAKGNECQKAMCDGQKAQEAQQGHSVGRDG